MSKSKVAFAFAIGAAVGAAVAYFFTTPKGKETLNDIKDAAGNLKDNLGEHVEKGKQIIKDISASAQSMMNDMKD